MTPKFTLIFFFKPPIMNNEFRFFTYNNNFARNKLRQDLNMYYVDAQTVFEQRCPAIIGVAI